MSYVVTDRTRAETNSDAAASPVTRPETFRFVRTLPAVAPPLASRGQRFAGFLAMHRQVIISPDRRSAAWFEGTRLRQVTCEHPEQLLLCLERLAGAK